MALTVIAGATATGKSALAVDVALALREQGIPSEIVNADAMQVYRGMNIGTAKITGLERRGVPHHLFDELGITEEATAAWFRERARAVISEMQQRGVHPIMVGGSGFYIEAVIHQQHMPGTDPAIRSRLEQQTTDLTDEQLHDLLREVDPIAADRIDQRNRRRVIRAIEVFELTGRPFSSFRADAAELWQPTRLFVLEDERAVLNARIAERTQAMWRGGMLDEVRTLDRQGLATSPTAIHATGYREALEQLHGRCSETQAVEDTVLATTRLVKKQRTWFRRYHDAVRLHTGDPGNIRCIADAVADDLAHDVDARPDHETE
ncbi:tRNA (adenosine(37)-N6)-dimethylallyltransferase MiaA [Pseudoclavibacter sp. CFCC 14310]|uniref:tRNA (adenosine(37)-N6)-dimethylallyltransferase MiaA n=1 Tax=Pseudoclavibacter sp. CFCC 14310 TaxID=2615180 RepID=UPI001301679E|nr:tRNA (adenosine(37)-N6)-dimethylallyltransferase MiaA [Pseudoclavibacter sp. CFCC 14310]KAB1645766.1 tRNA (adenosine(37)-N6)-dimethylallyltransferase MiaA [Pseudoclavibacter sp. CFCC 14310]